jgi:hypothetical protein
MELKHVDVQILARAKFVRQFSFRIMDNTRRSVLECFKQSYPLIDPLRIQQILEENKWIPHTASEILFSVQDDVRGAQQRATQEENNMNQLRRRLQEDQKLEQEQQSREREAQQQQLQNSGKNNIKDNQMKQQLKAENQQKKEKLAKQHLETQQTLEQQQQLKKQQERALRFGAAPVTPNNTPTHTHASASPKTLPIPIARTPTPSQFPAGYTPAPLSNYAKTNSSSSTTTTASPNLSNSRGPVKATSEEAVRAGQEAVKEYEEQMVRLRQMQQSSTARLSLMDSTYQAHTSEGMEKPIENLEVREILLLVVLLLLLLPILLFRFLLLAPLLLSFLFFFFFIIIFGFFIR